MAQTYLSAVSDRTRNAERLQAFTDCCGCICCLAASLFDCDCRTDGICPLGIFKADRLNIFYHVIDIQTCILCNFLSFFNRADSIFSELCENLLLSSLIRFK